MNILILFKVSFAPAYNAIGLYKHLYSNKVNLLDSFEELPRRINLYSYNKNLETNRIKEITERTRPYVFTNNIKRAKEIQKEPSCKLTYSNYPYIFLSLLNDKILKKSKILFVFKCT
jgi:hypothetical protein